MQKGSNVAPLQICVLQATHEANSQSASGLTKRSKHEQCRLSKKVLRALNAVLLMLSVPLSILMLEVLTSPRDRWLECLTMNHYDTPKAQLRGATLLALNHPRVHFRLSMANSILKTLDNQ